MNQKPDFGSLMPDTFLDLGNNSYGAAIDDYQAQMSDYDLRGPNAQFIGSSASYDEEGSQQDCCARLESALEEIEELLGDFCVNRKDKERGLVDGEVYLMSHSGSGNRTAYSPQCPGSNCPPIPVWVTFTFYKVSTGANAPGYFRIEAGYVNGFKDHLVISTADSVASIIHTAAYSGSPSYYAEYNPALAGTTVYAGFNVNGFAEYVSLGSFRYPDVANDIPVDLCGQEETEP